MAWYNIRVTIERQSGLRPLVWHCLVLGHSHAAALRQLKRAQDIPPGATLEAVPRF